MDQRALGSSSVLFYEIYIKKEVLQSQNRQLS